jgi:hypothetical protein
LVSLAQEGKAERGGQGESQYGVEDKQGKGERISNKRDFDVLPTPQRLILSRPRAVTAVTAMSVVQAIPRWAAGT